MLAVKPAWSNFLRRFGILMFPWKIHSDHLICLSVHVVPIVMDFYNAVYCSKAITTNVVVLN